MVLRLRQHNIGYTADGFYRSDKPTNSVKAPKEVVSHPDRPQSNHAHLTVLQYYNMHADITQENNLQYYRLERTRENKTAYVFKRAATISMSRVATRLIM